MTNKKARKQESKQARKKPGNYRASPDFWFDLILILVWSGVRQYNNHKIIKEYLKCYESPTIKKIYIIKTSRESQKAAPRTFHQLLRCQVVFTKRCHYYYCHYYYCHFCHYYYCPNFSYSFITIRVFEFCHNWFFLFSHNLSFNFVINWVFEFCHNLSFEFCQNLSFFGFVTIEFLSFIIFFLVFSQFEFYKISVTEY